MQAINIFNRSYVSHMTYDEKNELVSYLKPIKTYDYALFKPHELGCTVIAIKAKSCLAIMNIPFRLPGDLCVSLSALVNMPKLEDTSSYYDIYFPTLNESLQKYMYLAQAELPYIVNGYNFTFVPAYNMVQYLEDSSVQFYMYKDLAIRSGIAIEYNEDSINSFIQCMKDLKAADGAKIIPIDNNHVVTVYANMVPLNKADTLSIKLYDNPYDYKYMIQYAIYKKKMEPIEISCFYMRV